MLNKFSESFTNFKQAGHIGVGLSGGGDSVALLLLLKQTIGAENVVALHFDHNLRADSAADAKWAENLAQTHGIKFVKQIWQSTPEGENVQQAARRARYQFFAQTAAQLKLSAICTAHNLDDVAENFLMRAGKGSGLKGLAAMAEISEMEGFTLLRPLLWANRDELRTWLTAQNQTWLDDPSNQNDKFLRVRVRKLKTELEQAGVEFNAVAAASVSLRRADDALQYYTEHAFNQLVVEQGDKLLLSPEINNQPPEIALRVLEKIILQLNPQPFAPRTSKRINLLARIAAADLPCSLGGVRFSLKQAQIVCIAE